MKQGEIEVILFDLGGVLIELTGMPRFIEWTGGQMSVDEVWQRWMKSKIFKDFETGKIQPQEFAANIVKEFSLPVEETQFLKEFTLWPRNVYPGVLELLKKLSNNYRLACLSNTSELHWKRIQDEMNLTEYFECSFLSFRLGMVKPDHEIFQHVVDALRCDPSRILFFDDNRVNIDAAAEMGFNALVTSGYDGLIDNLMELGLSATEDQQL